jgi:hypothetical protein
MLAPLRLAIAHCIDMIAIVINGGGVTVQLALNPIRLKGSDDWRIGSNDIKVCAHVNTRQAAEICYEISSDTR